MAIKLFAAIVAVALMLGYLVPIFVKLKEPSLAVVMLLGIALMLVDLWQSLRSRDS